MKSMQLVLCLLLTEPSRSEEILSAGVDQITASIIESTQQTRLSTKGQVVEPSISQRVRHCQINLQHRVMSRLSWWSQMRNMGIVYQMPSLRPRLTPLYVIFQDLFK